ncbi:hypothetical protein GE061_014951 [Apolygus lucorum]|uniref:Hpc2-related domain-containing protein n=1 Tax=Apolygus lucorum TaxID=248454 RepID=A0A8S9XMF0_APOLU|nr:hypothetical protein GE061_014951 [Apolygus lucorum]
MMNDTKFSRLDPVASDPWKKTDPPATAKKEKSVRLTIDIDRGSSDYIFSYEALVKKARAELEKKNRENKNGGGLPDLMSHDSLEEQKMLRNIASSYEEKYGRGNGGGKRRYQSYADLGAGYDEEDSFIDNTGAQEEGIPEEMDTKKGGFYINSAVGEYESQLKAHKQLQHLLKASLQEKDVKLQQAMNELQRMNREAALAEENTEQLKSNFQKKFTDVCKVCTDVIDQYPDLSSEYS